MTNPEQNERLYAIFQQVLGCDPAGRAALLAELCAGNPELRHEVERFLAADEQAIQEGFLAPPNPPAGHADRDWRSPLGPRGQEVHVVCPHCQSRIGLVNLPLTDKEVVCPSCGSSIQLERESTAPWSPRKGQRWLGRFELIETAGLGAFGTVYKARDSQLDRIVAIKVPRVGNLATEEDRNRFLREGRSVAQLQHESIVPLHEVGEHEGVPYLVSDFVEGVSLSDWLTGRRPTAKEAARLIAEIADALQYAHERGVIHRDVKPSNIMLDDQGKPRMMDFGLAKRDVGEITMTIEGQVLGTPAYMSPEQARGQGHKVDGRSDVYSLGVVLYELLTGELPFRGNQRMLLHQVLNDEPKPPRKLNDRIPRDLETIGLKAMAKEPTRRYSTAAALAADLRRFLNAEPIQARPVGQLERSVKWLRRRPAVAASIGVSLAAVSALLIGGTWFTLRLQAANQELVSANIEAQRRRLEAETAVKKSRESQVRLSSAMGSNAAEAGDWWTALLWYHRAWELDQGPGEAAGHRQRLASVLARCPRLLGICLHKDVVREAEFAASGERIVTLADNSRAYLWDPHRIQYLAELRHEGEVLHATMDQAGQRVATAGKEGIVHLWDAADGKPLVSLRHPAAVHWAAFSADGTSLATACADGVVRLWQTDTGAARPVKIETKRPALFVVFSPDSSRLLTVDDSDKAFTWNAATGQPQSPPLPHRMQPASLGAVAKVVPSFSPDGRWVVSAYNHGRSGSTYAYDQNSLHFWKAGTEVGTVSLGMALNQVVFSPDSGQVLAFGASRTVWLLNVPEGPDARRGRIEAPREVQRCAFSPDGKLIATASSGGSVQFWDRSSLLPAGAIRSGEHGMSLRHLTALTQLVFSSDGRYLLSAGEDGTARLWQLPPANFLSRPYQFDCGRAHLSGPQLDPAKGVGVAYSPDGRREVRFGLSGKTMIQDRRGGGAVITLNNDGPVGHAEFSADGQRVATLGRNELRVWSAQTGEPIGPGFKVDNPVALKMDGQGHRVAVADHNGAVFLWEADTGSKVLEPFLAPSGPGQSLVPLSAAPSPKGTSNAKQTAIALSENGRYLAAATTFQAGVRPTVAVIEIGTGSIVFIVLKTLSVIQSLEFSRDGKNLLIASSDTTARVYECATGDPAGPPLHHPNFVRGAAFSSDGRYVVTADAVQNVRVWDGRTGDLLVPPLPARVAGEPRRVWFSSDDRHILVRSNTNQTIQWDLPALGAAITPSVNLMSLLTGMTIDETEGIAFLDGNTFRDNPELYGKVWLSWAHGGFLEALAPDDAHPMGMPAVELKGRELAGWGLALDPDNDCQIVADEKVLSLKVPGGWHDLLPDGSILNAPRVLRPVEGDFVFTAKVVGDFRPGGTSTIPGKPLYNAAGIVIWNDSDNFIRLDRYAFVRDGKAIGNVALLVRNRGQLRPLQGEAFPQGTCYLRVQRKGNVIIGAFSTDGRKWTELKPIDTSWPATLKVGLVGANSSSEPFSVNFNEVDLQARSAGSKSP